MPICPQCRISFHKGASDQCPACGYKLGNAEKRLGQGMVEFSRVLDAAGLLTFDEWQHLVSFLERLERRLPPVALCVYLTDRGMEQELPMHAHWILNHAKINHRSFGQRDAKIALEEGGLQMGIDIPEMQNEAAEAPPEARRAHRRQQKPARQRTSFWEGCHHLLYPTPPPVQKEWMLILMLDVQLEQACLSWGYKLDPYIDADSIHECVAKAYTLFRDRRMLAGIECAMNHIVKRLAGTALQVNANLRKARAQQKQQPPLSPLYSAQGESLKNIVLLMCGLGLMGSSLSAQDILNPALAASKPFKGRAAGVESFPTWSSQESALQARGQMAGSSRVLFAPPPIAAPDLEALVIDEDEDEDLSFDGSARGPESSLTRLPAWREHLPPLSGDLLIDEGHVLSDLERCDIGQQLLSLNAHKPYRLYVHILDASVEKARTQSAENFLPQAAQLGEKALLIQYTLGVPDAIDIAAQSLALPAEELAAWRAQMIARAEGYRSERDIIMRLVEQAAGLLQQQGTKLPPGGRDTTLYLPKLDLNLSPQTEQEQGAVLTRTDSTASRPSFEQMAAYLYLFLSCCICTALFFLYQFLRRRTVRLMDTPSDYRLSSPHGAGVGIAIPYAEQYDKKRMEERREFV